MKHSKLLGQTLTPDGTILKLTHRDSEYVILANGKSLMSSGMYGSEQALARLGCSRAKTLERPCVLIGGLGMGFTLRATLDFLPSDAMIVVAELVKRFTNNAHSLLDLVVELVNTSAEIADQLTKSNLQKKQGKGNG